jgi:hypothetical protein
MTSIKQKRPMRAADSDECAERATAELARIAFMDIALNEGSSAALINAKRAACVAIVKLASERQARADDAPIEMTMLEAGRRIAHVLAQATRLAQQAED